MLIFNCTEAAEMMVHWLRKYCGLEEPGILAARDRPKEVKREIWALESSLQPN